MKVFQGLSELEAAVGTHLGYGDWHRVSQDQIDQFAEATGDRQWIHVNPGKAAAGPFGGTVAHGFLTLSLIPMLTESVYTVVGLAMGVNYGANKVRFPAPVLVDSRLRAGIELTSLTPASLGFQVVSKVIVDIEGSAKPACVAECVALLVP
ncbi:MaoC family dehydratase [Nocardia fluminea]|uniref:MaoC family dehydratase n=1 Tax=Nocardia fluminea TaxID=134984 RepID=UPI00342E622B